MVSQVISEYVLLRNRLSDVYNQVYTLTKEKVALEKRCSSLGSELTEGDLPELEALLNNPYAYTSIKARLNKPLKVPESELPWL